MIMYTYIARLHEIFHVLVAQIANSKIYNFAFVYCRLVQAGQNLGYFVNVV